MQVLGTLGAAGLVALLAACSSSSPKSGSTQAGNAAAGTLPAALKPSHQGGGSVSDGLGHPVSVCGLLPVATVASISGEDLTTAKEEDTLSYKLYACDYSNAAGTDGVDVNVLADDAAPGYDGALSAAGIGAKPISGLGDKAFSSILGLQALFGNVSITVSNLTSDQASATIIRTLQPKL